MLVPVGQEDRQPKPLGWTCTAIPLHENEVGLLKRLRTFAALALGALLASACAQAQWIPPTSTPPGGVPVATQPGGVATVIADDVEDPIEGRRPTPTPVPTKDPSSRATPIPTPTPEPATRPGLTIYFLDVEAAEAMLLIANDGQTMLIDGGEFSDLLRQRLERLGIRRIDAVLPSHWHENHTRAELWALDNYSVKRFYWNGQTGGNSIFQQLLAKAQAKTQVTKLQRGDSFTFGNLSVKVMHPSKPIGDANTDALALLVSCGSFKAWLAGDTTAASEQDMLSAGVVDQVQVLKLGHHGGLDGTSQAFLDAVHPQTAVYSWMRDSKSIPDAGVLQRLKGAGVKVYGTDVSDKDDTLMLTSDCDSYNISR